VLDESKEALASDESKESLASGGLAWLL